LPQKTQEEPEIIVFQNEIPFREIDLFSDCKEYDNNLSSIVSDIKFVKISPDPPLDHFWRIYSIEVGKEHILISGLYSIYMYDKSGNFIRNIGTKGNGPKEFIELRNIQMDENARKIYTLDVRRKRIIIYDFEGNFLEIIPLKFPVEYYVEQINLLDSTTIIFRQSMANRFINNVSIAYLEKEKGSPKIFYSHLYPIRRDLIETYGADFNYLWNNGRSYNYMEYGNDTIFRIVGDSLIPRIKLTGNLKLSFQEHFKKNSGKKLNILGYAYRPDAAIFESNTMMVFNIVNGFENFYVVYNKTNNTFHRTHYENAEETRQGIKKMDYFVDDMITGVLRFNPHFQSKDLAIALISADEVCEKRKEILDFIRNHPSEKGIQIKPIIENFTDDDNYLMMIVKFK
jgi:hypothetical protein